MGIDILGTKEKKVVIVDSDKPDEEIVKEILNTYKNVSAILKKVEGRKGKERIASYKLIYGKDTEVKHREYGYYLKLDPTKVYFSPREATERQRLASKVKDGENVLVMFSGVAPIAIAIAKNKNANITCIEINEDAHKYAEENVKINKLKGKIKLINADVRDVLNGKEEYERIVLPMPFDRIVMPLPKQAHEFLDLAIKHVKKHGIIHFYYIVDEPWQENARKVFEMIKEIANKHNRDAKLLEVKKVLPYAPRKWKVVLDVEII